ncbi:hypothetical protein TTHERM_00717690 (macronuclear) [Tetrahymena thermophila SB210]|uniref:Uncharacterized protein n=1 Tax=Tetrahymena thermophila (strain SB210) TaxID=312017 RepID=Q23EA9_TETTS|nr:hypothetical protein TTHERM_00717690 [Tetrahymena thermophila SB210]EAR94844.2 hypothetical protein TTHERM_00717690 [Tetrahymena thermophila SB210]|eukprot:XP_001015089.2 hypothetical protein TTHERM_00717690 [Tetrahymena thermophila SB210]
MPQTIISYWSLKVMEYQLGTQRRQLHILRYSSVNNQYNYKYSLRYIVNDVQVSQTTGDIICFLVYQVYLIQIAIFNAYKNQNPVYVSKQFYNVCSNHIGYFNQNQDTIYYSDFFTGIISMNLLNQYKIKLFSSDNLNPYNQAQIVSVKDNTVLQVIPIVFLMISLDDPNLQLQQLKQVIVDDRYQITILLQVLKQ